MISLLSIYFNVEQTYFYFLFGILSCLLFISSKEVNVSFKSSLITFFYNTSNSIEVLGYRFIIFYENLKWSTYF